MFDTDAFFSNPATDPCGVIFQVIKIFVAQWSTFLALSLLQAVSLFVAITVASITIGSFFFFVVIRNSLDDGNIAAEGLIPLLILIFASAIAIGWVWCIYAGAMIRAAVEICAGGSPSACPTITIASKRGCNMIGFQVLFGLLICGSLIILRMVLNWLGGEDEDDDDFYNEESSVWSSLKPSSSPSSSGTIFLVCLLYALFVFIINISMIGAIPTIVVEEKSSCSALLRSWNLCKKSICLIFFSVSSVNLLNTFICFIFWALVTAAIDRIYATILAAAIVFYMAILPITMITAVVLYLSLRVRFEGLTQSELSESLSLTRPEPSAPLASDDDEDDKGTPLLHAELVTEVV